MIIAAIINTNREQLTRDDALAALRAAVARFARSTEDITSLGSAQTIAWIDKIQTIELTWDKMADPQVGRCVRKWIYFYHLEAFAAVMPFEFSDVCLPKCPNQVPIL